MIDLIRNILSVLLIWGILLFISFILSFTSIDYQGVSLVYIMTIIVVLIQIIFYFHSYLFKTELLFDFIGSISFISLMAIGLIFTASLDFNKVLISLLLFLWTSRLGLFLLIRRIKAKKDVRLQKYLETPSKLFVLWNMQAIWVILSSLPIIAVLTSESTNTFGLIEWGGFLVWLVGFLIQILADNQKRNFKINNPSRFINTGLWAYSRHPNYLGEILIWLGFTIISIRYLNGASLVALISPIFVFILLRFISGVPQLESIASERWGNDEKYQYYKSKVGLLFPKLFND